MWRTQSGDIGRAVAKGGSQKDGEFSLFAVDPNGEDARVLDEEARKPDSTILVNEPIFSLVAGQDLGSRAWVKGECSPSLADELDRLANPALDTRFPMYCCYICGWQELITPGLRSSLRP